jgi:hypothetical protein
MAFPGEIKVIKKCPDCGEKMPVKVCLSGAGYYIGQWCNQCGPFNRLSVDYYGTKQLAQESLDSGKWRRRDSEYHPGGR